MPNPFTVTDTCYLLQERVKQLYVWVIKLVTREEITHLNLDDNIITLTKISVIIFENFKNFRDSQSIFAKNLVMKFL